MPDTFLSQSIALLEGIEASPQKLEWCKRYSVYDLHSAQDELARSIHKFMENCYTNGLVITNYHQVIQLYGLDEGAIIKADPAWLEELPYLPTLACIAYHFRRDHFCEGSLICKSVASGAMLRMLRHLKDKSLGANIATTLETLHSFECRGVPDEPGVYWIFAPEGLPIQFEPTAPNCAAPLYPIKELSTKYATCRNKQVLYIGKAGGKRGLRQRLKQYMKYGWNEAVNHKGGRAIWQIQNAGMLLLTYELCSDCAAREHQLLRDYHATNGSYPLANWRG